MKSHGILFQHRRPSNDEYVAKDYSEFVLFALQAKLNDVEKFVPSVFFDTSSQTFKIEVDDIYDCTEIGEVIRKCAEGTLSQFELFGYVGEKVHQ